MNIQISNTSEAKNDSLVLMSGVNSFESLLSTLITIRNTINNNWSNCNSKNTAIKGLDDGIFYYTEKIIPALEKLGIAVNAYAIATEQLASSGNKNNGSGSKYSNPSEYYDSTIIRDEVAYANGTSNMSFLNEKLGNNQSAWNRIDEMYSYYKEKGLSDEVIAGILGNAAQESGFALDIKNPNSSARGLFQWTNITSNNQPSDWSFQGQMDHSWNQIQTKTDVDGVTIIEHLNNCSSVESATKNFAIYFEGTTDSMDYRKNYSNAIYSYIINNLR